MAGQTRDNEHATVRSHGATASQGPRVGAWSLALSSLAAVLTLRGMPSVARVKHWATPLYIAAMFGGILISTLPPFIVEKIKKPGWRIRHPDEVLVDAEESDPAARATHPAADRPGGGPAARGGVRERGSTRLPRRGRWAVEELRGALI